MYQFVVRLTNDRYSGVQQGASDEDALCGRRCSFILILTMFPTIWTHLVSTLSLFESTVHVVPVPIVRLTQTIVVCDLFYTR